MERLQMQELVQEIQMVIDEWCRSKCSDDEDDYLFKCKKCKYKELCLKLDELSKVIDRCKKFK